jgi:IS5 family transposase
VFTKNRDRLLEGDVAQEFFAAVLRQAKRKRLLSSEHFTVDGTLIEAWAGHKSFQQISSDDDVLKPPPPPDPGSNPTIDFRKRKRSNETHRSTTDPDSRLYKKTRGSEARLAYLGHLLTENRNGLVVNACVTLATGTAERDAAAEMAEHTRWRRDRITLGADRGYDTSGFVAAMRELGVTPHVAQHTSGRSSAIDARTTRHAGYAISQRRRKRVEEVFGWLKTVALMRKTRFRGPDRVGWMFTLAAAAYNLVRMRNLTLKRA